jgi:hypothetical protein
MAFGAEMANRRVFMPLYNHRKECQDRAAMLRKTQGVSIAPVGGQMRAATAVAAAAPGAPPTQLSVPYYKQDGYNWCWAACAQMVFGYYNVNSLSQCDLASAQFGQKCTVPPGTACDQPEWPHNVYPKYQMGFTEFQTSMSLSDVTAEINSGRPVEVYYAWTGGGAHVALITAVFAGGEVWVDDPAPQNGPGRRTFTAVQSAYALGKWSMSYRDIKPLAAVASNASAGAGTSAAGAETGAAAAGSGTSGLV